MAGALASVSDVTAVMQRSFTDDQGERILELIARASALFRVKAPWIDDRITDGSIDDIAVATAVAGVVKRVLLNPQALVAITTGPYSRSLQGSRSGVGNDGDLAVLDSDIAKVMPRANKTGPRTIHTKPNLAPRLVLDRGGHIREDGLAGYPSGQYGVIPVDG